MKCDAKKTTAMLRIAYYSSSMEYVYCFCMHGIPAEMVLHILQQEVMNVTFNMASSVQPDG